MPDPQSSSPPPAAPPSPKRVPTRRTLWGDDVTDDYAWLRDVADPATVPHLEAENTWTEAVTAPLAPLREQLFDEIKARTQETDLSVPWRKKGWWYFVRTEEGRSYAIHCRRPDDGTGAAMSGDDASEQVLLDENELAEGHDYVSVGVLAVSPDGLRLAYAVDHDGDERHRLRFRDLTSGGKSAEPPESAEPAEPPESAEPAEPLESAETIEDVSYGFAWAADSKTCWYTVVDDAERPWIVRRHVVGTDPADDVEIFREEDERFHVSVDPSRSGDVVVISSGSAITSESWLIDAREPAAAARPVTLREHGVEYAIAHQRDALFVVTNRDGAENFALWRAPIDGVTVGPPDTWTVVLPHRDDTRLEGMEAFSDHVVVHLRQNGLTGIRVLDRAGRQVRDLATPEPVFTLVPGTNAEYDTSTYRFTYQSLVTPPSVFQEDLISGERQLLKQQPVLGGYDPAIYESARDWATASDGTKVPISLVWRPDAITDGPAPCVLYGYGAYEASIDPWFSAARLSLLDRGAVFGIAHVRGGGEMGRRWYEDGKFAHKVNSFSDFVACGQHLVASGRTSPERLAARGASAGGLLMGAVANLAPELFRAIAAQVPFVDPLNTLLDPTLPLTVVEWEEWGNPVDDPQAYGWIKGYSPYENVHTEGYPSILATAGLNDPRVGFHEPAKWVARLRDTARSATDRDRPILLKVEMGAGHGGPSGRYDAWRDEAFTLAFLLDAIGAGATPPR